MENIKKQNYLGLAVIVTGIIVAIGLFILGACGARSVLAFNPNQQGITVNGEGTVTVKPDMARVTLGMESMAASAREAQRKNAGVMNNIVAELKRLGLADKDIQTTDFNLFPERKYDKATGRNQIVGYRAANQVTVTIRNLSKLGTAIDQSIQAGANYVQNVIFSVESPEKWREQAIASAVKEARSKADALAKASGMSIKRIIAMNESNINVSPYPMDLSLQKAGFRADSANASTPLEPGSVKVTATVQMNFGF